MIFPLIDVEQNVPQGEHPGAFAVRRKYHTHEGVVWKKCRCMESSCILSYWK